MALKIGRVGQYRQAGCAPGLICLRMCRRIKIVSDQSFRGRSFLDFCNEAEALLLFLIIFVWTPPHFWALAIKRVEDYKKAEVPMLPVTHGISYTKKSILMYTLVLLATSLLPYATGMLGPLYLLGAVVLGVGFLYWAIELMRGKNPDAPMQTFKYSIVYLMALFVVMLVDHYLFPVASL